MPSFYSTVKKTLLNEYGVIRHDVNEGLSPEGINTIEKWCKEFGCRKAGVKLIDYVLHKKAGLSSADLPDTTTFMNGLDAIEDMLTSRNYKGAFDAAKNTAEIILRIEDGDLYEYGASRELDDKKKEDVKESLNQQTKPVTEAREKVYFSDLEHKFGANPMPHPGSEPFLVIADNSFYGFKNAQSAKAFVQAVNSVDKEADFVDGPEEVYGPFEIKKI
jgi:hypothetical protein